MNLPILMYHHIQSESVVKTDLAVSIKAFNSQMNWLKSKGYKSITVHQLAECLAGRQLLPKKPVVITFDDGYQSVWEHGKPVLDELGYQATVFIVPQAVGKHNVWDENKSISIWPCMNQDQCGQLLKAKWEIGSHGLNHFSLPDLKADRLMEEVINSRTELESLLGASVTTFCYPFGACNEHVKATVKEAGYSAACAISPGTVSVTADNWALRRIYVKSTDSLNAFKRKISSWYLTYRAWRRR